MKNKYVTIFSLAIFVLVFDQITKYIINSSIALGQSKIIIPKILSLTYVQNTGAGFSILKDQTTLLIFISLAVIGYILFSIDKIKEKEKLVQVGVGFILGGAIGNLIDRVLLGYVIDFIDVHFWPIFNIADSSLTVGVGILIIYFIKNDK